MADIIIGLKNCCNFLIRGKGRHHGVKSLQKVRTLLQNLKRKNYDKSDDIKWCSYGGKKGKNVSANQRSRWPCWISNPLKNKNTYWRPSTWQTSSSAWRIVVIFWSDLKSKMAVLAYDWLGHFRLFHHYTSDAVYILIIKI
jgi:hypothetical protein